MEMGPRGQLRIYFGVAADSISWWIGCQGWGNKKNQEPCLGLWPELQDRRGGPLRSEWATWQAGGEAKTRGLQCPR